MATAKRLTHIDSTGEARMGDVLCRLPRDLAGSNPHLSGIRLLESADEIEQRGFAGAIGPDHAGDAAGRCNEVHACHRDDAAERDANPFR